MITVVILGTTGVVFARSSGLSAPVHVRHATTVQQLAPGTSLLTARGVIELPALDRYLVSVDADDAAIVLDDADLSQATEALFGATLTLPGIAAIVLSIGMEVDGNILIYERIREELLLGKSVRGAVDVGFSRAFSAILDGQLTTAAAGWVLLNYGSGPIKGFAVMLLVGVFTTFSTRTLRSLALEGRAWSSF